MHASQYFKKRSYTFRGFLRDLVRMIAKSSKIRDAMKSERISSQFRERIMLAVTAVNECKYCEWGHTKTALKYGCTEEEINEIMAQDFGSCDSEELIALAFALHYAETGGLPSDESKEKLLDFYGKEKSQDILLFIQMITMGNLLGNTLDAFESRLKGTPPEKGSFFFEFMVYSLGFPFVRIFKRKQRKNKNTRN
ncbi:MAG: carboxymuconolactone decarboxylase family protein [Candidatus Thorarchaeota archaeon]